MFRAAVVLGVALTSTSPQAATVYQTGNQLFARCSAPSNVVEEMVFLGYVIGVSDAYGSPPLCVPQAATAKQLSDISCQYLRNHPEKRHLSGQTSVVEALRAAFPCSGQ